MGTEPFYSVPEEGRHVHLPAALTPSRARARWGADGGAGGSWQDGEGLVRTGRPQRNVQIAKSRPYGKGTLFWVGRGVTRKVIGVYTLLLLLTSVTPPTVIVCRGQTHNLLFIWALGCQFIAT